MHWHQMYFFLRLLPKFYIRIRNKIGKGFMNMSISCIVRRRSHVFKINKTVFALSNGNTKKDGGIIGFNKCVIILLYFNTYKFANFYCIFFIG